MEPVVVAWEGIGGEVEVRTPASAASRLEVELTLEDGRAWPVLPGSDRAGSRRRTEFDGTPFVRRTLPLTGLPLGYHRLDIRSGSVHASAVVISAPDTCATVPGRTWGAFLPLYAVRSGRNWGCGDFSDVAELLSWVEAMGGVTLGCLPVLATFLDEPFDPSPYSPVSRLFWNELFVDVERVPEMAASPESRELVASPRFRKEIGGARRTRLVDYTRVARLKREVLEVLSRSFFDHHIDGRRKAFDEFVRERPELRSYATFRAASERYRAGWQEWPSASREGRIPVREIDPHAVRYHQYVQFLAEEQLRAATHRGQPGRGLYVDLPLGVNPGGYDTWRFRTAFAQGVRAGAPPDVFFAEGQDWGFPPMHPERARDDGHAYFRATLSNVLRHAGMLRLDHVMGFHRMYWIPGGLDATAGVYVHSRPEELYAILALESRRAGVPIVGEDLGTVPPYVRPAMARHGLLRSYVLQLEPLMRGGVHRPRPGSLASLNTHDMPPFRAFWEGLDIEDRLARGLIDSPAPRAEREERARQRRVLAEALREAGVRTGRDARSATVAGLRYLGESPANVVVVNLEDLWGETEPQNRPGTGPEQPNWRRKAAKTTAQIRSDPGVTGTLEEVDRLRRGACRPGAFT